MEAAATTLATWPGATRTLSSRREDAERSYRRAGELCEAWHDPILGVSACLNEQGKQEEALSILEEAGFELRQPGCSACRESCLNRDIRLSYFRKKSFPRG